MKKTISIVLALIICIGCLCGCEGDHLDSDSDYTPSADRISKAEAIEIAKQSCVNAVCRRAGVQKVSMSYGSETATSGDLYYIVKLSGSYMPIDKYGNHSSYKSFDFSVFVFMDGTTGNANLS